MRTTRLNPAVLHFARHYVEMVVAMLLGMLVLGMPLGMVLPDGAEIELLTMASTMTVPMVAWMRHRGHGWRSAWEMSAAMFVPTVAALALLWTGVAEGGHTLLMIQHIAMFPLMLVAMLLRPGEYTGHAGG
jgi:flagellar biosynthetic protein FliP